jgi:murein DD-endopeptidase MepM/ murein hydrolase activator NlpD
MIFLRKLQENKKLFRICIGLLILLMIIGLFKQHRRRQNFIRQELSLPKVNNQAEETVVEDGWTSIRPRPGDTLGRIFNRVGLSQTVMMRILKNNPHAKLLSKIMPNQEIRFKIEKHELKQMIFPVDALQFLTVSLEKNNYKTAIQTRNMTERREYVSTLVRGSLYQTAKLANIPVKLIEQMNQIFFWQVQLGREIRPGDRLNLSYQAYYINDQRVKVGDILAVSYKHANGVSYEAIRHEAKNGSVSYYRPDGSSLKKAFSRYPIRFSHISSSFGSSRKHPILHYRRPHKGIDLAAPIGTPIYAIGEGRISFMGRQNGYGNMVKINHDRQYTTVYAHMLRFQKGLRNGSWVKRDQLIGFVGQSGLATGPHCHYELHVNRIPRNPSTVALPQALPIARQEFYAFNQKAKELFSQLKLYEESQLASAKGQGQKVG